MESLQEKERKKNEDQIDEQNKASKHQRSDSAYESLVSSIGSSSDESATANLENLMAISKEEDVFTRIPDLKQQKSINAMAIQKDESKFFIHNSSCQHGIVKASTIDVSLIPNNQMNSIIASRSGEFSGQVYDINKLLDNITPNWVKRHLEKFPFPKDFQIASKFISSSYEPKPQGTTQPQGMTLPQGMTQPSKALIPCRPRDLVLPSNISRFWDWDLFCLADQYGFGIIFIRLRARRQNEPSQLPPSKNDEKELNDWFNRLFVGMVYERRVSDSLERIFISDQMFWSDIPRIMESIYPDDDQSMQNLNQN